MDLPRTLDRLVREVGSHVNTSSDGDGREKVCRELIVTHGNALEVLDPAKCIFDEIKRRA